jgi:hypothetical protein
LPTPVSGSNTSGGAISFSLVKEKKGQPAEEAAPGAPHKNSSPVRFFGFADLGAASLKPEAAERIQVGETGVMFTMGAGLRFFSVFDAGAGIGMVFFKDHNPFTNFTTGGERKSTVTPLLYFAQVGLQVPIPVKNAKGFYPVWLATHVGAMGVSADRSIPMCSNCDVEDIKMKSGSFVKPEFKIMLAPNVSFGVAYWLYCDKCDFKDMITLTMSGTIGND